MNFNHLPFFFFSLSCFTCKSLQINSLQSILFGRSFHLKGSFNTCPNHSKCSDALQTILSQKKGLSIAIHPLQPPAQPTHMFLFIFLLNRHFCDDGATLDTGSSRVLQPLVKMPPVPSHGTYRHRTTSLTLVDQ